MHYLTEAQSHQILGKYGISVPKSKIVQSAREAAEFADKIRYPVVLKVMSQAIVHKSDAGAVAANIWSPSDLLSKYEEILSSAKKYKPHATIDGVIVEKQIFGSELIVGSAKDSLFGHTLMLGSGGIFAEIMRDTVFRIIPVSEGDVAAMIGELKALPILKGARGHQPINFRALAKAVLSVSKMVEHERISELDINPLIVNDEEAVAADARIILE